MNSHEKKHNSEQRATDTIETYYKYLICTLMKSKVSHFNRNQCDPMLVNWEKLNGPAARHISHDDEWTSSTPLLFR